MSSETTELHHDEHAHGDTMTKSKIIKIAVYLSLITCVEFIIALVLVPKEIVPMNWANPLYIVLTLFKAYLIVAFFMHLKFEKKGLVFSIIVPILFIIGLILVLTNESHHWITLRH
ncbi:cytochrome C oxidase subunit IV family protein [Mucilaginibacter ximonensis]|uniref:Cytochrome C oxidase subunit IV family protein n=1 Tax=Mucilaginibacter ximonensis TaxID=538021 RepID=A0ABW5YGV4_9SPHI